MAKELKLIKYYPSRLLEDGLALSTGNCLVFLPSIIDGTQYYLPFTVSNTGGETATSVQVLGKLQIEQENIQEEREQLIDFPSGDEQASGAFIFTHNPERGQLMIRVAIYKLPEFIN